MAVSAVREEEVALVGGSGDHEKWADLRDIWELE